MMSWNVFYFLILNQIVIFPEIKGLSFKRFPPHFKFGVATSAYQIEGAWDEDGKGENIWDRISHTNPAYTSGHNADTACDSYNKYKEDIDIMKKMGVQIYRFSLSWSRILPTGFTNRINEKGVMYYRKILAELERQNIEPLVTLYHWDLPQPLQDIGGWPNPLLADYFADYARLAFKLFGNNVKMWITFNEAKQTCQHGYGTAAHAPAIYSPGVGDYLCTHTVLKAHAKAYHIYDEEFRSTQEGRISLVADGDWFEPATVTKADLLAAEAQRQFIYGMYLNPIVKGNYPKVMIDQVTKRSLKEGFARSRLPQFTPQEMAFINGTYDYLAFNIYSTSLVRAVDHEFNGEPGFVKDIGAMLFHDMHWKNTSAWWLKVAPSSARRLLNWIKDTYNNPEIMITENGYVDEGELEDNDRIEYMTEILNNVLEAIYEDNVNVTTYLHWSIMDNFEWTFGYSAKLGLYSVDFDSPNKTRTPKKSVKFYTNLIKTRMLQLD